MSTNFLSKRRMHPQAQTPPPHYATIVWIAKLLVQHLHHSRLTIRVLDQHAARTAYVVDDLDELAEAGCRATGLGEAGETEVCALAVFENDEELDDEGDGLELKICGSGLLANWVMRGIENENEERSITSQNGLSFQDIDFKAPCFETPCAEQET